MSLGTFIVIIRAERGTPVWGVFFALNVLQLCRRIVYQGVSHSVCMFFPNECHFGTLSNSVVRVHVVNTYLLNLYILQRLKVLRRLFSLTP